MLLHFFHYNAPITRVLPLGVVECFDDFQRIISDRMFEHRQLKLRGFPIQTRNDKIIVIFLLPKLPVFGNFSTMFQVKVLRRSNLMKSRRWRRYRTRLSIGGITTGHAVSRRRLETKQKRPPQTPCNNTANHTFKRLLNRHLISIKCPEGTNETEYIMSLAARANEIQHRA